MKSIVLPLLAAAAVLIPSNSPARPTSSPVQASVAASATILPAARVEWSRFAAGIPSKTGLKPWDSPRLVRWTGPRGEVRHDLEFQ